MNKTKKSDRPKPVNTELGGSVSEFILFAVIMFVFVAVLVAVYLWPIT